MKKLLCLLIGFSVFNNLFAGPTFELQCFNHTQNTWQYNMTGIPPTLYISANSGDSITLLVAEEFPGFIGPWFCNGDSVPNSAPTDLIHLIVYQSCTYTVRESEYGAACSFVICVGSTSPPTKPAPIGFPLEQKSPLKACPGETKYFSLMYQTPCATSYTWNLPAGATLVSGAGTSLIQVLFDSTFTGNDSIGVTANNTFGSSQQRKAKIVWGNPIKPTSITGQFNGVCGLSNVFFKALGGSGTFYNWTLPSGATFTNSSGFTNGNQIIKVNFSSTSFTDIIKVTLNNGCGVSAAFTKKISSIAATPDLIIGSTIVCAGSSGNAYSISPVSNSLNYTWEGPIGSHISDGTNTSINNILTTMATSVIVNYGVISTNSKLKVKANNACGSSSKRVLQLISCTPRSGYFSSEVLKIELFPNPFTNTLTVMNNDDTSAEIIIYDITSRKLLQQQFTNSVTLDTEQLSSGIYIYEVRNKNGVVHKGKILKD